MLRTTLICLVLAAATLAVYWQATDFDFVNLDDPANVIENQLVTGGLNPSGIIWALRTSHPDYWRPVTWLSLMLDTEIHGDSSGHVKPFGYHLTNILLHTANVVLLFLMLRSLTGAVWRSAFVAGLFALHPMHVESVAWITERKDVLAGLFGILCIWTYGGYIRQQSWFRYGLCLGLMGLGLMAKPMLVPLPGILLLLDVWPLKRIDLNQSFAQWRDKATHLLIEKIPFVVASALSCYMTMRGGSASVSDVPLGPRLANVLMSYTLYVGKLFRPIDLAVYYPYRGLYQVPPWETWKVIGAAAMLLAVIVIAILLRRRAPFVFVGWFWFLGVLVPVIGLMQVGAQSMADRFAYFSYIGLYIAIVWSAATMACPGRAARIAVAIAGTIAIAACTWLTCHQLQFWRNTTILYDHALAVTKDNWKVHDYYGNYLVTQIKDPAAAILQFKAYLKLRPDDAISHVRLGALLAEQVSEYEAMRSFEDALRADPNYADAHYNLAIMLWHRGENDRAIEHLETAIKLNSAGADEYRLALTAIRAQRRR